MTEKRVVTCPRCGFRISDRGDAASPGLTGDVRTFSRSCLRIGPLSSPLAEQAFDCPKLLAAVRQAALVQGIGRTR